MIGWLQVIGAFLILPKSILPEDNGSTLPLHIRQLASSFRKHLQLIYMSSDRFHVVLATEVLDVPCTTLTWFTRIVLQKWGTPPASMVIASCLSVARTHHLSCTSPALLLLYPHVKETKAICKMLVHKTKCNSIYSKAYVTEKYYYTRFHNPAQQQ